MFFDWVFSFSARLKEKNHKSGKAKLIKKIVKIGIIIFLVCCVIVCAFWAHYKYPKDMPLYKAIDDEHYEALSFLSTQEKLDVMASIYVSMAVYPVTGMEPVGALSYYGNSTAVRSFFASKNCSISKEILAQNVAKYVVSDKIIECNWTSIYEKKGINIYKVG
jgi:hypothetical protein